MQQSLQEVQLLARKTPQVFGGDAAVVDCSISMRRGNLCSRWVCVSAWCNIKEGLGPFFLKSEFLKSELNN